MHRPDPLRIHLFHPQGLRVSGSHDPTRMPLPRQLEVAFTARHPVVRAKVLAHPDGFEGHRACLKAWRFAEGVLHLETGYRTYSEGVALRELIDGLVGEPLPQPDPAFSWGASLVTVVFLPQDCVLAGQRSPQLLANPGRWSCGFTEVLEPTDVQLDMAPLAQRLLDEELPALARLGEPTYVGLGTRERTYTWQILSVLDLSSRKESATDLVRLLQPDAETVAWAAIPLRAEVDIQDLAYARELRSLLKSEMLA